MMRARAAWTSAKAQIRERGWEAQFGLKDSFGPDLDELEKKMGDVTKELRELFEALKELGRQKTAILDTMGELKDNIKATIKKDKNDKGRRATGDLFVKELDEIRGNLVDGRCKKALVSVDYGIDRVRVAFGKLGRVQQFAAMIRDDNIR